ncbi:NAD(FAD)-utilizing dehydrogenase [Anoxybacillus flavithermus TNO-09.006]|uniref:NAD(P)/FAD-dependent oxidoreductase n=1 Tax=Anoxybacillus flavithermus TaxID=33934 RepID=A0AAX2A269_9BACL|nr:NAD(P)/FAD-dependent oxidoreductase [Anoxybacillus flavithermus]ASA97609.1 aminoacetone oxidase family FAD-binding enzyme [Anoxybacillus flavithermus]ELK22849.1 NAD(FAD)-utilizing dehydrogenase [Anoxybacillus flavithermus TNO-09.006]MBE2905326.1 NAD(P)/FAD-dependent oxidoreductase [Anoxybacillus flavithermus]MBE2908385.1 NAD(P)/FAD-dependent oxidoreductase [Anoxybacillus flavithermus]MBE2910731.1 NAD(P)/FAD-dependent oxidoreductase [Anoxybacillus flavithermus]
MTYDVIVIGGGPSGLMAAIAAGERSKRVLLLDKGDKLGRKLAISGGGRCNVTNRRPVDELIQHIPGNGRFLYGAFSMFNNEDIIRFFERLGVPLKEEDHGRMFPVSDSAQSVVQALLRELKRLRVDIRVHTPVKDIEYKDGSVYGVTLRTGEMIRAKAVVVAAGGKSVPHTGSTGDGYAWAEKAGHTITELFPTEVPIVSHEPFIQKRTLQGLSLRDVALSVLNAKGKRIVTHRMDMIFTHFGVSGPAALRCSQFVVKQLKKQPSVMMTIDALPDDKEEALFQRIVRAIKEEPKKTIKNIVKALLPLPERYILFLFEQVAIDPQTTASTLGYDKVRSFVATCKTFSFSVHGTLPLEKAFVTGGGVSVKEVHPKEMASKLMKGLYFCGEILDIHGYTGGYNITAALVTGRLAGMHAAIYAKQ